MKAAELTPGDAIQVAQHQFLILSAVLNAEGRVTLTCVPYPHSRLGKIVVVATANDSELEVVGYRKVDAYELKY